MADKTFENNVVLLSKDRSIMPYAADRRDREVGCWFNAPSGVMVCTGFMSSDEARAVAAAFTAAADAADAQADRAAARAAA